MCPTDDDSIGVKGSDGLPRSPLPSSERRRVLRGGLAAGPVVMTLATRPVLAQTACLAPSAMVSVAASGGKHAPTLCSGLTPEQWAGMATRWPSPYVGQVEPSAVDDLAQTTTVDQVAQTSLQLPTAPRPPIDASTTGAMLGSLPQGTTVTSRRPRTGRATTPTTGAPSQPTMTTAPTLPATGTSTNEAMIGEHSRRSSTNTTSPSNLGSRRYLTIGAPQQPIMATRHRTIGISATRPAPPSTGTTMMLPLAGNSDTAAMATGAPAQPATATIPGTPFHGPTTGLNGAVYGDMTMLDVINADSNSAGLGRYVAAALLNARAGRTPVLDESGVRMMWNDVVNRGYYEPVAGVKWGAGEIVAYLRTTMG